jgi:hypothetical protein
MGSNAAEAAEAAACTMVAVGAAVTEDSSSWYRVIPEPPMSVPLTELLFAVA